MEKANFTPEQLDALVAGIPVGIQPQPVAPQQGLLSRLGGGILNAGKFIANDLAPRAGQKVQSTSLPGQIFQSTVGSNGLGGLLASAGNNASDYVLGKITQQMGSSSPQLAAVTTAIAQKAAQLPANDPRRAQLLQQANQNTQLLSNTAGMQREALNMASIVPDSNDSRLTRGLRVGGQAINTAATFAPVARGASLGVRALEGAALGSAASVGQNLATGNNNVQDIAKGAGYGALLGAGIPVVGAALGATARGIGRNVISELQGVSSGTSGSVLREAYNNTSKEFLDAMRGKTSPRDVVENAKDALRVIKDNRGAEYAKDLNALSKSKQALDINPLRDQSVALLKDFGVSVDTNGVVDFTRSKITSASDQSKIQQIVGDLLDWGNRDGDLTPAGFDLLKQRIEDHFSESSQARSFVTQLGKATGNIIKKEVPEYENMLRKYSDASKMIEEIDGALGLGDRKSVETALNKLQGAFINDSKFKTALIDELQRLSGKDVKGQIAGALLNTWRPRYLTGRLGSLAATIGGGGATAGAAAANLLPGLLLLLPNLSPRFLGEFYRILGGSSRVIYRAGQLPGVPQALNAIQRQGAGAIGNRMGN